MIRTSEESSPALVDVYARLLAIIQGVVLGVIAMGVGSIKADWTRTALEARTEVGAACKIVAGIIHLALIYILAGCAVHLVTHRAREAMKIGRITHLQALGTLFVKKK